MYRSDDSASSISDCTDLVFRKNQLTFTLSAKLWEMGENNAVNGTKMPFTPFYK